MSLFFETCTPRVQANSRSTGGFAKRDLDSETASVPCSFQPDRSEETIQANRQRGGIGGKLFYPTTYTLDSDDKVYVRSAEWEIDGPEQLAPLADAKWVPLFRRVP